MGKYKNVENIKAFADLISHFLYNWIAYQVTAKPANTVTTMARSPMMGWFKGNFQINIPAGIKSMVDIKVMNADFFVLPAVSGNRLNPAFW